MPRRGKERIGNKLWQELHLEIQPLLLIDLMNIYIR